MSTFFKSPSILVWQFLFDLSRHISVVILLFVVVISANTAVELLAAGLSLFYLNVSSFCLFAVLHRFPDRRRFVVVLQIFFGVFAIFGFLSFTPLCSSILEPNLNKKQGYFRNVFLKNPVSVLTVTFGLVRSLLLHSFTFKNCSLTDLLKKRPWSFSASDVIVFCLPNSYLTFVTTKPFSLLSLKPINFLWQEEILYLKKIL